jgi:MFS family permease
VTNADEASRSPAPKTRHRVLQLFLPGEGPPLREVAATSGWYPLVILTTLNVVDELDHAVIGVFAPNIQRYFDLNDTALGALIGVQVAMIIVAAVPIGYWAMRTNRARLLRWSAAFWSVFSTATAVAIVLPAFVITRLGSGIGKAAVDPVGKALLADHYPPTTWNRVFAVHNAANPLGGILGPLMAGIIGFLVAGDAAWRLAFPILTVPTIVALVAARRLHETEHQMAKGFIAATMSVTGAPKGEGFVPSVRRLLRIPTFRRQLVGIGVLGFGLVGVLAFGSLFYERVHGLGEGARGVVFTILGFASLIGTLLGGNVGERIFQSSPQRSARLVGLGITVFSVVFASSVFIPSLPITVFVQFFAIVAVSTATAPLYAMLTAITPPNMRPLMFSLLGLCVAVFGGVLGGVIVGAIAEATNIQIGLAALAPSGIIGGLLMARGATTIEADIAAASGLPPASGTLEHPEQGGS